MTHKTEGTEKSDVYYAVTNTLYLKEKGLVTHGKKGKFSARKLTTENSTLSIKNADGIDGDPVLDVNASAIDKNALGGDPLTVTKGGTGKATLEAGRLLVGNGTNGISELAKGTNGQVLTADSKGTPAFQTLPKIKIEADGFNASPAEVALGDTLTLTANPVSGINQWHVVKDQGFFKTTSTLQSGHGYIIHSAGEIKMLLPETSKIGDVIRITGMKDTENWEIELKNNQEIYVAGQKAVKSIGSINSFDSIHIVCVEENKVWNAVSLVGNLAIDEEDEE